MEMQFLLMLVQELMGG